MQCLQSEEAFDLTVYFMDVAEYIDEIRFLSK